MISRRNMLKALGIGGLLPFVRGDELKAAPLDVPTPQIEPISHALGSSFCASGTAPFLLGTGVPRSFSGMGGTASFSRDGGTNWYEFGRITKIDYPHGITDDDNDGGDEK